MRKLWLGGVLVLGLAGCADPKIVPLLGNWTGTFKVENGGADAKKLDFKAYLQLYRTHDKFKLHLENYQQGMDMSGTWSRKGDQIVLAPGEITFNNPSEADQQARGMKIVSPQDLRAAYGKSFVLNISGDDKVLTSPTMSLGDLTGRHLFGKGLTSEYAEREYERMRKEK